MARFKKLKAFFNHRIWKFGLFWSWNVIFMVFLIFLEAEVGLFYNIVSSSVVGFMPWDFTLFALLVLIIPLLCIILAATKFQKRPEVLVRLFYGVEVPLMILCFIRLGVFRELNPSTFHFLVLLTFGMLTYLWDLIFDSDTYTQKKSSFMLVGHGVLLFIGIYSAIMTLFYAIPLAGVMIKEFFQFDWFYFILEEIVYIGYLFLSFLLLLVMSGPIFIGLPIAIPTLYISAFFKHFKRHAQQFSKESAYIIAIASIVGNLLTFVIFNYTQRHIVAFDLLEKEAVTVEEKRAQLSNTFKIRHGLAHAYLSPYRYVGDVYNNHIEKIYQEVFHVGEGTAHGVQAAYNFFAAPLLFRGDLREDREKAKSLYEDFFDTPIDKGEKEAVNRAIHATWSRERAEAGLLDEDKKTVLLTAQDITLKEEEGYASIEIKETYQNQTFSDQEIFYYFSLPAHTVITGLWLSDEEEKPKKYAYTVAPRGAAQEVYKREVERRVDPSLLEQVGPYQYRLRTFPIPRKRREWDSKSGKYKGVEEGGKMMVWLQLRTMAWSEGQWKMPQLVEKRNVYWDEHTKRTINQETHTHIDHWLPTHIASSSTFTLPNAEIVTLADGQQIGITQQAIPTNLPHADPLAVMIDRSYSMREHQTELAIALEKIRELYTGKEVDVFLGGYSQHKLKLNEVMKELASQDLPEHMLCYGSSQPLSLIRQMDSLRNDKLYGAAILLTDEGSYELAQDSTLAPSLLFPLFMVHIDGKIPRAYPDALIQLIYESGGDAVFSMDQLAEALAIAVLKQENTSVIGYEDGYLYELLDSNTASTHQELAPFAVQQFAQHIVRQGKAQKLTQLDALHALAKEYSIVTPLSSMIVLVNERQKEALKEAEEKDDRFEREVEDGEENVGVPINMTEVSGTPEPEEWVMIALVFMLLGWGYMKRG